MCEASKIHIRSATVDKKGSPMIPPWPGPVKNSFYKGFSSSASPLRASNCVCKATTNLWGRLFDEGYRADVAIHTDDGGIVYAHANLLGMASPVLKGQLKQPKASRRLKTISIQGFSYDAVRVFIRFLYSSCYEEKEMEEFVVALLVLSHLYAVSPLKQECEQKLKDGLLTTENVVDIFQLALLCDAPRLSLMCHRMILKNFKAVSVTEGWRVMQQSHPTLERELLESAIDEDNRRKERIRKINERKIYLLLYDAMEALVHIYRDGCQTIGPCHKDLRENKVPCKYIACKGLELLVRHFAGCKLRVPGGCIHCKRMWQLLDLHSRLCADSDVCKVPLCRNFKERIRKQSKKDDIRWKMLVKKILKTKKIAGASFLTSAVVSSLW
ncbi:BTB/POZ and TAZ domain-containing protein 4 [Argentina anserina]|uniref:BTB/POZ and TAZ domain-containing protein 4 n=1 Tax=Argentina anserina TaxID=57926 RepID=UPI002176399F|nr:BTB/POZ and TAZ domain-containing protein 4 [Potentilla anserina]